MYPDQELMEAYDRWCENEYDTEGDYAEHCEKCGADEPDEYGFCSDCLADEYDNYIDSQIGK